MAASQPDSRGLEEKSSSGYEQPSTSGQHDVTEEQEQDHGEKLEGEQQQNGRPQQQDGKKSDEQKDKDKGPEGGYDSTPIPKAAPGYTLKFTFHRAVKLPMGDLTALSSDPYVMAQLNTDVSTRHKEDPKLRFRSFTVRKNTDPEWNEEWIIANVPASGATMKVRVYDEDPADHDDLLGKCHVRIPSLNDNWPGLHNEEFRLSVGRSSKRAILIRAMAVCLGSAKHMQGEIFISVEMLGRTGEDGQNGRPYTVGPCRWFRHYSPMLGRIAHTKQPDENDTQQQPGPNGEHKKTVDRYNFQANQIQLQGPVPAQLYHRFVEFKPWVKRMFTSGGLQGMILGKTLHHQHSRVYNFGRSTVWGHFPQGPCKELTQKFLELVHYDQGGRIFTYVLTLDALWRFTETGKEFGVDMLSKHTMHSDVSIYIAFSGEFFIRRLKHGHRPPPPQPTDETSQQHPPEHAPNESHPPQDIGNGPPEDEAPPNDPSHYQLVIDNDSGTYRPNAKLLPQLADFFARALPGLHIQTLDCQADEEKMAKMKGEQRERKKKEGDHIVYAQGSQRSSISSSDDERLDAIQAQLQEDGQPGSSHEGRAAVLSAANDAKRQQKARAQKAKSNFGLSSRQGKDEPDIVEN